ncbi:MAG: 4'-phosphopantetheinyl transferase superfamily protein [Deltaproteobacteria bacterium]|jgi:phosphopantetheinyl transferase|nr:4'-phosphopantetheinyl transferase superfamily protein [Deltaproteobacteria bacterium]
MTGHSFIDIYLTDVRPLADCFSQSLSLVPPARLNKINRLKIPADKLRSLGAGLLLRHILSVKHDRDLIYNEFGQPGLALSRAFISLSHSGPWAALAVSQQAVGLDLEVPKERKYRLMAEKILTSSELNRFILSANPAEYFLAVWTLKESLLKATGRGLADSSFKELKNLEILGPGPLIYKNRLWYRGHRLFSNVQLAVSSLDLYPARFWIVTKPESQEPLVTLLPVAKIWDLEI